MNEYEITFADLTKKTKTVKAQKYAIGADFITFFDGGNRPLFEVAKTAVLSVERIEAP